ncbi:MAG: hypothetical protein IJK32_09245 [Bacteroidales bacterium]|nr:hypothetical protein [Bacteroidales bacterium]
MGCTRDLPDPGQFIQVENGGNDPQQPQQPSQPQTPSEPQQPVQTDPQPQTPPEPQQPEGQVDIPDSTFRAWILWNYDSNKDGVLDQGEAASVTKIEFSTENVTTLDGIQYFPNLTYLHAQGIRDWDNDKNLGKLTELDLSGNPKLQHIHLIYNNIKTLKLAECPDLDYLDLDYNEITELDVKGFHHMTLLQVSYNKLKTIDVSGLDILDEFHCADNPLETITLSNPKLMSFRCAGTLIKELDLSKCPKINNLDCSNCPNLTTIKIAKGQVIGNITKDDKAKFEYYE